MGAMQPWHLLVLLFVLAIIVSVVLLVVLLARGSARSAPTSTPQTAEPTLSELADLHARGSLTDEEFAAAKRKILDL